MVRTRLVRPGLVLLGSFAVVAAPLAAPASPAGSASWLLPGVAAADDVLDDEDVSDDDVAYAGVTDVVVKLKPGEVIESVNARWGTTVVDRVLAARIYLLLPPPGNTPADLADRMQDDPALEWVEPNYAEAAPEGNPTYKWGGGVPNIVGSDPAAWKHQQALTVVRVPEALARTTGTGAVVAVVDTGVWLDHPQLVGRLRPGYDFVDDDALPQETRNRVDDDTDGRVDEGWGHGTHVAGIVAAVAPRARIIPLRVLDDEGRGNIWSAAEAIRWATAHDADVINLSLGTTVDSELLSEAVEDAEDEDVVVVASAGNDASSRPQFPAAAENVIAVGSTDLTDAPSRFSNHGSWVDVVAPGEDVVSSYPVEVYASWDGTSMAAPFVAGQAALLISQRPDADEELIVSRIRATAVPVADGQARRIDIGASTWP